MDICNKNKCIIVETIDANREIMRGMIGGEDDIATVDYNILPVITGGDESHYMVCDSAITYITMRNMRKARAQMSGEKFVDECISLSAVMSTEVFDNYFVKMQNIIDELEKFIFMKIEKLVDAGKFENISIGARRELLEKNYAMPDNIRHNLNMYIEYILNININNILRAPCDKSNIKLITKKFIYSGASSADNPDIALDNIKSLEEYYAEIFIQAYNFILYCYNAIKSLE